MERDGSKEKVGDAPGGGFSEGFRPLGLPGAKPRPSERPLSEKKLQRSCAARRAALGEKYVKQKLSGRGTLGGSDPVRMAKLCSGDPGEADDPKGANGACSPKGCP